MKIVLLGANGRTGQRLIDLALIAGDSVTALVRSEDRLAHITHERLDVRVGSPCDERVLEEVVRDHDVVVSVLGPRWPTKAASAIYRDSAAAIVAAMPRAGVQRLLVTSSALLFPPSSWFIRLLRWLVPNIVQASSRMEERIRTSGLDWTIARTSFLTNAPTPDYRLGAGTLPEGGGAVSREAVANFLLSEAKQPRHRREVVGLCGG